MKIQLFPVSVVLLLLLNACSGPTQNQGEINNPDRTELQEFVVYAPERSYSGLFKPIITAADEKNLLHFPVKKISTIPANQKIGQAVPPFRLESFTVKEITPGESGFFNPVKIPIGGNLIRAGAPRIITAREMRSKDRNPANFRIMNKLQGLLNNKINCLLEDDAGNMWIGTDQGLCRYDGQQFFHYTTKEGLSNNNVSCLLEDAKNHIWAGTTGGGLCRFDGSNFLNFDNSNGFVSNNINCLATDRKNQLWIGTDKGASLFDGKEFTNFSTMEGLIANEIYSILPDRNGKIWFGTEKDGFCSFDGKSFSNYSLENEIPGMGSVNCIRESKDGKIWFGTSGTGAVCFDGKNFSWLRSESHNLAGNRIYDIHEAKNGNIWFGTENGISQLTNQQLINYAESEGLSGSSISCILETRSGDMWFGTKSDGINQFLGNRFTHFTVQEGLSNNIVRSILKDRSGNIWFATAGDGLSMYDGQFFYNYRADSDFIPDKNVSSIIQDKSGNYWFGTNSGAIRFSGKEFTLFTLKENQPVLSILEDRQGNIWFGTIRAGICKFDGKSITYYNDSDGLGESDVFCLEEDRSGNIWFSSDKGLKKIQGNIISKIRGIEKVKAILCDQKGHMWFGTEDGIREYDGKYLTSFKEKDGLINDGVLSILEDSDGDIWFGTRFGLSRLKKLRERMSIAGKSGQASVQGKHEQQKAEPELQVSRFKNYSYEDGFLGIGCQAGAIAEGKDHTIWVGTNDRLTAVHKSGLTADNIPPAMEINEVSLFNEAIDWGKFLKNKSRTEPLNGVTISDVRIDGLTPWHRLPVKLSLRYDNNNIAFHFSGISTSQPGKIKYSCKLLGHDENWSKFENRADKSYTKLPFGTYTFQVQAENDDGYKSRVCSYEFTIRPPVWFEPWAIVFEVIFIIAILLFIQRLRERRLLKAQKILQERVADATAVIRSQKEEVIEQKKMVETKHRQLSDSIKYAERIQRSFLASREVLASNLSDHFIFFQPKDMVSGDFYWAGRLNNGEFSVLCADSTGHGVPGAIMSLLIILSVEKTTETQNQPAEILNQTRRMIVNRLEKENKEENVRDGMDCTLMSFNPTGNMVSFAGAHNPLWIIRDGELTEYKADRMTVGRHERDTQAFTQHEIAIQKGDMLYAFSDGMPDQFGGPNDRKFGNARLKELLLSIVHLPAAEQCEKVKAAFSQWKGNQDQVDDVIVMGIRV